MRSHVLPLAIALTTLGCGGDAPVPVSPAPSPSVRTATAPSPARTAQVPVKPAVDETSVPVEPKPTWCDALGFCALQLPGRPDASHITMKRVWGSSGNDVYVAGNRGILLHYDGSKWAQVGREALGDGDVGDVWGTGPNDVYAPSSSKGVAHFDGKAWTLQRVGPTIGHFTGAGGEVLAAWADRVDRKDGSRWVESKVQGSRLLTAWAIGPRDVYAAGIGSFFHFDGSAWTKVDTKLPTRGDGYVALYTLWASGAGDVFAGGIHGTVHFDGKAWSLQDMPTESITGIAGTGPSNVLALAESGSLYRWEATGWQWLTDVDAATTRVSSKELTSIWLASDDDLWATGDGGLVVRRQRTFTKEASGTTKDLRAVSGADGELWAVGDGGTISHFVNGGWTIEPSGTSKHLRDVWAAGNGAAWAVGDGGTVLERAAGTWKVHPSGTKKDLLAIAGKAGAVATVAAVGRGGTVVTYDGKAWTTAPNRTNVDLVAVAVRNGLDDLVAVGDAGTVVRSIVTKTGRDMTAETVKDAGNLRAVWVEHVKGRNLPNFLVADANGTVFSGPFDRRWDKGAFARGGLDMRGGSVGAADTQWAAGSGGRLLVRAGKGWQADAAPGKVDILDVFAKTNDDVVAVGKGGVIVRRTRR